VEKTPGKKFESAQKEGERKEKEQCDPLSGHMDIKNLPLPNMQPKNTLEKQGNQKGEHDYKAIRKWKKVVWTETESRGRKKVFNRSCILTGRKPEERGGTRPVFPGLCGATNATEWGKEAQYTAEENKKKASGGGLKRKD